MAPQGSGGGEGRGGPGSALAHGEGAEPQSS